MTRLGAFDALGRGIANVRANREVVLVSMLGSLANFLILLVALVPWLGAFGSSPWRVLSGRPAEISDWLAAARNALAPGEMLARIGAGVLALLLASTLVSVVISWYYGGMVSVLAAGEAQAPAGRGRDADVFRTWSWRYFAHQATRLTWKTLLYLSALFGLILIVGLLAGLLAIAVALVAARRAGGAALAVGCGGMLPLLFAGLAIYAAGWMGFAALPREGASVRSALALGFNLFGQRLGACVALMVLFFCSACAVALFFGGAQLLLAPWATSGFGARLAVELGATLAQLVFGAVLNCVFLASCIALAHSETARAPEAAAG